MPAPVWIKGLCARICKNVHSTRLSGRRLFSLRRPPNNTFSPEWPRNRGPLWKWRSWAESWNVYHNCSARPRSLETRKGRGFPHSRSDGLRLSNWTQLLNPRKSNVFTDSRPEPIKETGTAKLERKSRRIQNHAAQRERGRDKQPKFLFLCGPNLPGMAQIKKARLT